MRLVALLILLLAPATQSASQPATAAARWIARGEGLIAQQPDKAAGYNVKALGLSHRARETGDAADYERAMDVLQKSFALEPDNFEGRKVQAWILLGQHRYREARDLAEQLNKKVPDDLYPYAFLSDANVALGDYDAAEKAAQVLLDLRPDSVPALTRGAQLRELFGDPDGALELYGRAYQATPADEPEERAWTLTQAARVAFDSGKAAAAEQIAEAALKDFADYPPALTVLADVLEAAGMAASGPGKVGGQQAKALDLRRQVIEREPQHAEHHYALAQTLARAGESAEAQDAYARFRRIAEAERDQPDNANGLLVRYLAGPGGDPAAAVALARSEADRHPDVYTLDALAVALLADGRADEARTAIDRALAVGIKDPEMLFHAGQIAAAQGSPAARQQAAAFVGMSLNANPSSPVADAARSLLGSLAVAPATQQAR